MGELIKLSWRDRIRGKILPLKKAWNFNGGDGGWIPLIRESFPGAWQSNVVVSNSLVTSNWAVFSCLTLIANDLGKMPAFVMHFDEANDIWERTIKRKVLDFPNNYQLWPDFVRSWVFSLLLAGNTYVLRVVDRKGFVTALYVLDPRSVKPLVTPTGQVYYQLAADNLTGLPESITVPASAIMHDRVNAMYHPLVGISPIYASGIAAMQGLAMQENSTKFFQNASRPGGILTAPGAISDTTAQQLKAYWETEFAGDATGKIAVVGDGLKYEAMSMSAADSQMIEQLKFTGEMICATFHVPPYKVGIGAPPSVGNLAALNQQYYDQCLHPLIDSMERHLDQGLEISYPDQVWLDTSELLRMDPSARWDAHVKKISSGAVAPNEVRKEENLAPMEGGDTPYLQQQNYSLKDLALRSKQAFEKDAMDEGNGDVQSLAMNGAQVSSLMALVAAAAAGEIPIESAAGMMDVAFPTMTQAQIDTITAPLKSFEPKPEPAPAAPTSETPDEEPEEPDEEATDEELAIMAQIIKQLSAGATA